MTNVNGAPVITSAATGTEAENTAITNVVYDINATDDGENTGTLTYSITGDDAGLFNINATTGEVTFIASPNFEAPADLDANNVYDIIVHADDGTIDTTQAVAITVTNVNGAPVITSAATGTEAENTAITNVVYDINATDDGENTGTLTYSITGDDAGLFNVNATTGEVTFIASPNFEAPADLDANNVYDIIVHADDGTIDTTQAVAITVTNVNGAPVITSAATGTEAENTAITNVVYDINATDDGENTGTLTYAISGDDAGLFNINATTGEVTFIASPNFEAPADLDANNVYDIIVHADDGTIDTTQAVAITVTNVNGAPVITSAATGTEAENTAITNVVYDINATDDGENTGTLTYSITGDDAGLFNINATTGEVTFIASPNFEAPADLDANNVYDIIVHADDGTIDTTQAVAITVTNVNDPPINLQFSLTNGGPAATTVSVNEHTPGLIGYLSATDPDGDPISYSTLDPRFVVLNGNELHVASGAALDFEQLALTSVVVRATANAQTITATIDVTVLDITPDVATGSNAAEEILGGDTNDTINALGGNDTVRGGLGNDRLTGGDGSDSIYGGGGQDIMFIDAADIAGGVVDGGADYDYVHLTGTDGVNFDMTAASVDWFGGNAGADTVTANGTTTDIAIWGRGGADSLTGGDGHDILLGGADADTLTGGAGNDGLYGNEVYPPNFASDGAGDVFYGGAGSDVMFVDGADTVLGQIDGGADYDYVVVRDPAGVLWTLAATSNVEWVAGDAGADSLDAGALSDGIVLHGYAGDDTLRGGSGSDSLYGEDDNDELEGGNGIDHLFGGAGNDHFVFNATSSGIDYVYDWNNTAESDKLVLVGGNGPDDVSVEVAYGNTIVHFGDQTIVVLGAVNGEGGPAISPLDIIYQP